MDKTEKTFWIIFHTVGVVFVLYIAHLANDTVLAQVTIGAGILVPLWIVTRRPPEKRRD